MEVLTKNKEYDTIMADNRIAYGLAVKNGIDTKGMSPKEVWDALKGKGITPHSVDKDIRNSENVKKQELEKKFNDDLTQSKQKSVRELPKGKNSAAKFHFNMKRAKESVLAEDRWRVDIHPLTDYMNDKLFVTEKGSCVAVEPNGNIISVCKITGDNIHGGDLLKEAISNGGDRLDAFGEKLYKFYTKNGFEPVSWTPFDKNYAPDGWKSEYGEEPVIFYKYTGQKYNESYDDFLKRVKESKDYDKAQELRDKELKK